MLETISKQYKKLIRKYLKGLGFAILIYAVLILTSFSTILFLKSKAITVVLNNLTSLLTLLLMAYLAKNILTCLSLYKKRKTICKYKNLLDKWQYTKPSQKDIRTYLKFIITLDPKLPMPYIAKCLKDLIRGTNKNPKDGNLRIKVPDYMVNLEIEEDGVPLFIVDEYCSSDGLEYRTNIKVNFEGLTQNGLLNLNYIQPKVNRYLKCVSTTLNNMGCDAN